MFSVNEYYQFNKVAAKTTRHIQKFSTLEEAKTCADSAYQAVRCIPESEAVWIGVMDESRSVMVYTQPGEPTSRSDK